MAPELNSAEHWWFGISPEGIGTLGALLNFSVAFAVSRLTPDVPDDVQQLVNNIRIPKGLATPDPTHCRFAGKLSGKKCCWLQNTAAGEQYFAGDPIDSGMHIK